MGEREQPVTAVIKPETDEAADPGFLLHGVVSARRSARALTKLASGDDELVEHRGLCALVHVVPYRVPDWETEQIREHSATIERAMRQMRLHVRPAAGGYDLSDGERADRSAEYFMALRRRSRAAFKLPAVGRNILSAAFLVNRADWVSFVEYTDELDADHPEFLFDLTGPWPPYDFVRMTVFSSDAASD
jgi:hypothetical protein